MSAVSDATQALAERARLIPLLTHPGWELFRQVFETEQGKIVAEILSETTQPAEREKLVVRYNARAKLFGTPTDMIKGHELTLKQDQRYQEGPGY